MANGYAGRFLHAELTNGRCAPFTVEEDLLRRFIGGSSLAAKLFLDGYPLDAEAMLIIEVEGSEAEQDDLLGRLAAICQHYFSITNGI